MALEDILGFLGLGWLGRRQARKAEDAAESVGDFRQAVLRGELRDDPAEPMARGRGLDEDLI
jgi:hypothetical protein